MTDRYCPDPGERLELSEQDLAIAGEFGDAAIDKLRTVLAFYEAMRASEDVAR